MTYRLILVTAITLILPACTTLGTKPADCFRFGAETPFEELQKSACSGAEWAEFELAEAYEYGDGVEQDLKRAVQWYKQAAQTESGETYIYMPPVGGSKYGTVMPITSGTPSLGHAGAQYRLGLMYLDGHGVRQSKKKGRRLLKQAAHNGSAEAAQKLESLGESQP